MPSDRTFVTEIATGLGALGEDDLASVIACRTPVLTNLSDSDWDKLSELWHSGAYAVDFDAGFKNGGAFFCARDGLNGRHPRLVEWTGGRRPPGDEVVPSDLRVDHVYLVSCKYLSRILHNSSPARLFEGLLTQDPVEDLSDWYQRLAPVEYQMLYEACVDAVRDTDETDTAFPALASELARSQRRCLSKVLHDGWPSGARSAYERLCGVVAEATAKIWSSQIDKRNAESVVWRLLRIGSAPYFILGTSPQGSMRLRIDTPWDWRQRYRLLGLDVAPQAGGQPRVRWSARYRVRRTSEERAVNGHVEIRWSHGRFAQPPEAKVYLDTMHRDVPGYNPL
jgi:hypothetical protein